MLVHVLLARGAVKIKGGHSGYSVLCEHSSLLAHVVVVAAFLGDFLARPHRCAQHEDISSFL